MAPKISPLAPASRQRLPPIPGVRLATANCGIRYKGRDDLLVAMLDPGTTIAGVLTRSLTASAPVDRCRDHLGGGKARAHRGQFRQCQCLHRQARQARSSSRRRRRGEALGCAPGEVFVASTGVIGEPLIRRDHRASAAHGRRALNADGWAAAAAGDHDHRHLSQGRDARRRRSTARAVDHQRHRQGLGHDRARHGDHAGLRLHRRADRRRRCCRRCCQRGADRSFNCDHRRRRHLDQRHAAAVRDRAGRRIAPIDRAGDRARSPTSARRSTLCCFDLAMQIVRDGEGAHQVRRRST